ncbi:MAG: CRISPR-associated endonuclease Cas1, partial [Planctomycetaceae bacterium]|nr:CRISPR-associated endonuclease Cas1 [Planctomycetaceae bacterium]
MITPEPNDDPTCAEQDANYLPARMINEFVYCPRLFYLMHVEGQFEHNAHTTEGVAVHSRVDAKTDPLPVKRKGNKSASPKSSQTPADPYPLFALAESDDETPISEVLSSENARAQNGVSDETLPESTLEGESDDTPISDETFHARSVMLANDRLGVIAKLDLIEVQGEVATPIDYKKGHPRYSDEGDLLAWPADQVQMCLQALILRENGFQCDRAEVYYRQTRQRVQVPITEALIARSEKAIQEARRVADFPFAPPPLIQSPKCIGCSLSAVCLPDETHHCQTALGKRAPNAGEPSQRDAVHVPNGKSTGTSNPVRLPATPRDDLKPLYLNTQGLSVGKKSEMLEVKENGKVIQQIRMRDLNQVSVFGNIQISTQAMQSLLELDIPLVMHSQHGYFYGMLQGTGLKNILLRRQQFRLADQAEWCLGLAKQLVIGKIRNQRTMLMRNHVSPPESAVTELKILMKRVEGAERADELLGIEGAAARVYFQNFAGMIKPGDEPVDPMSAVSEAPQYTFDFRKRNRRPPRDPVNALLSLAYSMLAKDLTIVAASVGFDPYLGFYHLPRPGR